ncbi:GxxExxY protein [Carboxylicivirga mesophila]|uniref:GxxExxY protein n=1 Tax=Carboxylicivirga mesophila TaxID=1166478 RepID=A0ABS5K5T1_9BACT|nr:GxxExxY protein [Carboxylicivirga mesophila]MBS2210354.1 GxxExxY protein [Carboxylicivirga mesophila]
MANPNDITRSIIECALKVHSALGPGMLESAYQECLYYELKKQGHKVEKEKELPLIYDEVKMECGYRIDLLVDNTIIVELKAVNEINNLHIAQILSYLKMSNKQIGLILNFNVTMLRDGIKRIVNNYHKN